MEVYSWEGHSRDLRFITLTTCKVLSGVALLGLVDFHKVREVFLQPGEFTGFAFALRLNHIRNKFKLLIKG